MRRMMSALGTLLISLPGLIILLVGVGLMVWGWLTYFFPPNGRVYEASTGSATLILGAVVAFLGVIFALLPFAFKVRKRVAEEHEEAPEAGALPGV